MFLDDDYKPPDLSGNDGAALQEARLRRLEEEFAQLRRHHFRDHRSELPSPLHEEGKEAELSPNNLCTSLTSNRSDDERREKMHYELRQFVPHLSPEFNCGERDAVLLISAIRSGSGAGNAESWEQRLMSLDAEKRMVQSKLERRTHECEELKDTVAELRQKLRMAQGEAQASVSLVCQKRDEVRRQLLLEESRTQRLKIRNGQLEMELERLRGMLRSRLGK